MEIDKVGVHASHCCYSHGCKYGDLDCPVAWGTRKQEYRCEECDFAWESAGSPTCSMISCKHQGFWTWTGLDVSNRLVLGQIQVNFFLCNSHDRWHRIAGHVYKAQPVEKRIL